MTFEDLPQTRRQLVSAVSIFVDVFCSHGLPVASCLRANIHLALSSVNWAKWT